MRALTSEEMHLVAGGDGTSIVVTGHRIQPGSSLPVGWGQGGGGGGGSQYNTGPARAGQVHQLPGVSFFYTVNVNLDQQQTKNLDAIVSYGISHGFNVGEIANVAASALLESSLRETKVNTDHVGLGQYNQSTWNQLHEAGSINNTSDQIAALYNDMKFYESLFAQAQQTDAYQINESHINIGEYFEIKHHGGRSETNWAVADTTGETYRHELDRNYVTLGFSPYVG